MSNDNTLQHIKRMHQLIIGNMRNRQSTNGVQAVSAFMNRVKNVGMIDGLELDGKKGRYLLIDGESWLKACRKLKNINIPHFVMWEESAYFMFLEQLLQATKKKNSELTRNSRAHSHL